MWHLGIDMVIGWSNAVFPVLMTLLFHSTVIGGIGILAYYLVRKRGAVVQSMVLRTCLAALVIAPLLQIPVSTWGIKIPRGESGGAFRGDIGFRGSPGGSAAG